MKILHVITSLQTGGAEKLMLDLIPQLTAMGNEVDLLLFDGVESPFKQEAVRRGIKVYQLGIGGSVYSPKNLLKLIPWMRKYDIVHTHNTAPQLFAAIGSMFSGALLCTTEHNTSNRRRNKWWYAPIDRFMFSRYKEIICISPETELALQSALSVEKNKCVTICNGINVAQFSSAAACDIDKSKYGCSVALMQVAGFRHQKDQDTVIRALATLPENVHLYLVGDGERRAEIEALVDSLNLKHRVHMLGIRADVPSLLKAADIVVMSSHYEGFGLAAVEGMAAGKPVLASDVDGLRQVVEGAGVIFPKGDEAQLASEIEKIISSKELASSLMQKGLERAKQFDISAMAAAYNKVYTQLAEKYHRL